MQKHIYWLAKKKLTQKFKSLGIKSARGPQKFQNNETTMRGAHKIPALQARVGSFPIFLLFSFLFFFLLRIKSFLFIDTSLINSFSNSELQRFNFYLRRSSLCLSLSPKLLSPKPSVDQWSFGSAQVRRGSHHGSPILLLVAVFRRCRRRWWALRVSCTIKQCKVRNRRKVEVFSEILPKSSNFVLVSSRSWHLKKTKLWSLFDFLVIHCAFSRICLLFFLKKKLLFFG